MSSEDFHGCKLALFNDQQQLLVFLRDNKPDIEAPDMWDLPGGGREGDESPEACVLRELEEEFGLTFTPERLLFKRRYHQEYKGRSAYFFVGSITQSEIDSIMFGDEGQKWTMMDLADYLDNPKTVPRHQKRMRDFLALQSAAGTR